MLYLIVVLIYSLVVKTTAPYEEEDLFYHEIYSIMRMISKDCVSFILATRETPFSDT